MHSNVKVAFEVSLSSEKKMMLIMRIIHIPDISLVQQGCIKQIYLGSLQQYRIRRNVLIRYHCISDKYARKSAGHFP